MKEKSKITDNRRFNRKNREPKWLNRFCTGSAKWVKRSETKHLEQRSISFFPLIRVYLWWLKALVNMASKLASRAVKIPNLAWNTHIFTKREAKKRWLKIFTDTHISSQIERRDGENLCLDVREEDHNTHEIILIHFSYESFFLGNVWIRVVFCCV